MSKQQTVEVTISNKTVLRVISMVLLAVLFVFAIRRAAGALVLIGTALFLALALNAPVHWISEHLPGKRRGSRKLATAISFFIVVAFLAAFLASIIPPLARQTSSFITAAPDLVNDLRNEDSPLGRFVQRYNLESQTDNISSYMSERVDDLGSGAVSSIGKFTSGLLGVVIVLVMTFMMLIEGPSWLKFGSQFITANGRPRARRLTNSMYRVIKGYVNGQVLLAAAAAIMMLVPLLIIGVSYPIALMVIVFICGLIPMVGHTIGAVILTVVALFHSFWAAIIILGYYILYQQIENYVIQPRVQANTTDLPPLMVFMSVLVGISFGGLLGGLVAIPVAGCARILILDYLETKGLITKRQAKHIS